MLEVAPLSERRVDLESGSFGMCVFIVKEKQVTQTNTRQERLHRQPHEGTRPPSYAQLYISCEYLRVVSLIVYYKSTYKLSVNSRL